jgi:hypothetical protein
LAARGISVQTPAKAGWRMKKEGVFAVPTPA